MAAISYLEVTGKWRAQIRRKGHPQVSKVFRLKADAEAWARNIEAKIEGGGTYALQELRSTTVGDLIERYRLDVAPHRKGWKWDNNRCLSLKTTWWAAMDLTQEIPRALLHWSNERLNGLDGQRKVSAATVNRDLNLISSIFQHAIKRLQIGLPNGNPVSKVPRPQVRGGERNVTWTDQDLHLLLKHLEFDMAVAPSSVRSYLGWVLLIARHTGLRLGNVVGIKMARIDLERRCVHFGQDEVKNNEDYDCPLSTTAAVVIAKLMTYREGHSRLFVSNVSSIGTMLRAEHRAAAAKHPQLAGLRTHDLRHTWTTEMVPKVPNALTMMKISGRRTFKSLARYYNPKVEDLAKLLD